MPKPFANYKWIRSNTHFGQEPPPRSILSSVGFLFEREHIHVFTCRSLCPPEPSPLLERTEGFTAHSFHFHAAREQGRLPPRRRGSHPRADSHRHGARTAD